MVRSGQQTRVSWLILCLSEGSSVEDRNFPYLDDSCLKVVKSNCNDSQITTGARITL